MALPLLLAPIPAYRSLELTRCRGRFAVVERRPLTVGRSGCAPSARLTRLARSTSESVTEATGVLASIPLPLSPPRRQRTGHARHARGPNCFLDRKPCATAAIRGVVARIVTGPHDANRQDPHVPMRYDTGRPRAVIRFRISQPRTASLPCPAGLRARRPSPMRDL